MGVWGNAAWDSDAAADWFGDLLADTKLPERVEETLNRDLEDAPEEIRAAAYLLVVLGRVYVWPVERLDRDLRLAVRRLQAIKDLDEYQDVPELQAAIDDEIRVLQARLRNEPD